MAARVVFRCPGCEGRRLESVDAEGATGGAARPCPDCGFAQELAPLVRDGRIPERCPVCGCQGFYRHKDFNRYLGIAMVISAGVADLFLDTLPLCLAAMTVVDLVLLRLLPDVVVCYGCEAILRGVRWGAQDGDGAFDLERAEHERLAAQRRLWERTHSVAGRESM